MLWVFKTSLKLGICGGAVYITAEHGVWGNSQQSAKALNKLLNSIPSTKSFQYEIPSWSCVRKFTRENWNKGVTISCGAIGNIPSTTAYYSSLGWDKAKELATQPQPSK